MPLLCNIQDVEVTAADAMQWLLVPGVSGDTSRCTCKDWQPGLLSVHLQQICEGDINEMTLQQPETLHARGKLHMDGVYVENHHHMRCVQALLWSA